MNSNTNFQKIMDETLMVIENENEQGKDVPKLLLHSCCAPCSSYVLEYLTKYFEITILFYNPNISEETEYTKRVNELKRLINEIPVKHSVTFMEGEYSPQEYFRAIKGLEHLGERSERCYACYKLRMDYTARIAKKNGFDYFTTTLSISPHKNADWINEIGQQLSDEYEISYLYADFKKKNGYKRSIELSKEYHLYRQDFCGCVYSKAEEEKRKRERLEQ
ncbi:MAG: epoxyqueuosine reductase QueH [Clostridiales bacterium]|nr:epoxyqueuosine reductase QueH [Clostridiales bacterium]